jgi:hypothetical protein
MAAAGAGSKRKWEDTPLAQWSTDAVLEWLRGCDAVSAELLEPLCARVTENEVDGEVLATLTEADLGAPAPPRGGGGGAWFARRAARGAGRALARTARLVKALKQDAGACVRLPER